MGRQLRNLATDTNYEISPNRISRASYSSPVLIRVQNALQMAELQRVQRIHHNDGVTRLAGSNMHDLLCNLKVEERISNKLKLLN